MESRLCFLAFLFLLLFPPHPPPLVRTPLPLLLLHSVVEITIQLTHVLFTDRVQHITDWTLVWTNVRVGVLMMTMCFNLFGLCVLFCVRVHRAAACFFCFFLWIRMSFSQKEWIRAANCVQPGEHCIMVKRLVDWLIEFWRLSFALRIRFSVLAVQKNCKRKKTGRRKKSTQGSAGRVLLRGTILICGKIVYYI